MFYRCFQTLENNKSPQPLRPWAFISFLVCGNPGKTLALVFEILRKMLFGQICMAFLSKYTLSYAHILQY